MAGRFGNVVARNAEEARFIANAEVHSTAGDDGVAAYNDALAAYNVRMSAELAEAGTALNRDLRLASGKRPV